jgi:L-amino acid N-acyltransferase YncA
MISRRKKRTSSAQARDQLGKVQTAVGGVLTTTQRGVPVLDLQTIDTRVVWFKKTKRFRVFDNMRGTAETTESVDEVARFVKDRLFSE